jgi:hypothetical protein
MEGCMVPKVYKVHSQTSHVLPEKPVYNGRKFVCLFVFGATAASGPGPPHSRGF